MIILHHPISETEDQKFHLMRLVIEKSLSEKHSL